MNFPRDWTSSPAPVLLCIQLCNYQLFVEWAILCFSFLLQATVHSPVPILEPRAGLYNFIPLLERQKAINGCTASDWHWAILGSWRSLAISDELSQPRPSPDDVTSQLRSPRRQAERWFRPICVVDSRPLEKLKHTIHFYIAFGCNSDKHCLKFKHPQSCSKSTHPS